MALCVLGIKVKRSGVALLDLVDVDTLYVERVGAILEDISDGGGWEILFVDDGSTDATLPAIIASNLLDARVRGISLSRNFGKEAALSAGLDHYTFNDREYHAKDRRFVLGSLTHYLDQDAWTAVETQQ